MIAAVPAVSTPPGNARKGKTDTLREATEQFEAFFVGYLLKQMRKTTGENGGLLPVSPAEKTFRDLLDDETAQTLSRTHQMGIADLLFAQLAPAAPTIDKPEE